MDSKTKSTASHGLSDTEKAVWFAAYNKGIHRLGRVWLIGLLAMLVAVPFLMGLALDTMPDMHAFWRGFFNVAILYYPTSLVEYLIYAPMLGSGASYLSFVTGNLSNLKVPCAVNARDLADAHTGTPENEVISTLSVATSSLVTIVVLAVGVLALVPLQPVLESPVLTPAFDNVVPALFGALGLKYFIKGRRFAAIPLLLSSAACIFVPALIRQTSTLLIVIGALTIGVAFVFYRKGLLEK